MKPVIFLFATVLILTSSACDRESSQEKHTIQGRLIESCENPEGLEGVPLGLQLDKPKSTFHSGGAEYLDRILTGPNGDFKLTYEGTVDHNIYINKIRGQNDSPRLLMMGLPRNRDLEIGTVYHNIVRADILFIVETPYPFSDKDTLKVGGKAGEYRDGLLKWRYIPGPFSDGQKVVLLENAKGTIQTYFTDYFSDSSSFFANRHLLDREHIEGIPYQFTQSSSLQRTGVYTLPCQENHIKIRLDSSMLGG